MFDLILPFILKYTVDALVLAVYLHHNYVKLRKEGRLKKQINEEVAY